MGKRQVFYSFHYARDYWRVQQVRNMGKVEGNESAKPNKWEEIEEQGDEAIQNWIDENLEYRSCTVVLVGECTARRKWIDYEIEKSWRDKKGIVGIHIHNLKDSDGKQSNKGRNPFIHITSDDDVKISTIIKCYNPPYESSTKVYEYIEENIEGWIEEAIEIRKKN